MPSSKPDIYSPTQNKSNDSSVADQSKQVDTSNKDHYIQMIRHRQSQSRLDAKTIIEKTLARANISESMINKQPKPGYSSKEAIKNNSLYQKFARRLAANRMASGAKTSKGMAADQLSSVSKKPKSKTLADVGITNFQAVNKTETTEVKIIGMHKRAESENLKKIKSLSSFHQEIIKKTNQESNHAKTPSEGKNIVIKPGLSSVKDQAQFVSGHH